MRSYHEAHLVQEANNRSPLSVDYYSLHEKNAGSLRQAFEISDWRWKSSRVLLIYVIEVDRQTCARYYCLRKKL